MTPHTVTQQQEPGLLAWFLSVNYLGGTITVPRRAKRQPPSFHRLSEIRAAILGHINNAGDADISTPELLEKLNTGMTQTQLANHIKSLRSYDFIRKTRHIKSHGSIATFYTITERGIEAINRYMMLKHGGETCH